MFKSDKPKEVKKSWDSYDASFNLEDFVAKASRSATRSKAPARHTAGRPADEEQIRNPARPAPEDQGKGHVEDLRRVIDELKCFDVKAIKQRPDPGAKILRDRINNTLADMFGRKTKEYQDLAIWSLDTLPTSIGGAWHPLSEIQEGYRKGITDAIVMLGSVLAKLEEDLLHQEKERAARDQLEKGLPSQEEEKEAPDPGKNCADLRRAVAELTSFDVITIKQRPDPRAKALTDSINNTLGDIFGRNTKEYHNYAIWSLDTSLPVTISGAWQSLSEVREGYRKGIIDAVAMLSSVLDKLEKDLPSPEEVQAVIAKVPPATKRGRPRERSFSDPHNQDEETTKHEFLPKPPPLDLDTTAVPDEDKNLPAHDRKDGRTAKKHNEMSGRAISPETTDSAPGSEVKAETTDRTPQRRRAGKPRVVKSDAVSTGEKEEQTAQASAELADKQASPDVMGKSDGLPALKKPDYEDARGSSGSGTDWKATLEALEEKLEQFEAEEPVFNGSDPDLILLGEADALVLDEDVDLAGLVNRNEDLETSSGLAARRKTALELLEEKLEQFEAEKSVSNGLNLDPVLLDEPDALTLDGDDARLVNCDEGTELLAIDEDNLTAEKPLTGWGGDTLSLNVPPQGQVDDGALVLDGDDQLSVDAVNEPAARPDPLAALEKKLRELGALGSTSDTHTAEDWIPATIILDESDEEVIATYPETPSARFVLPEYDEHLIETPDEKSEPAPFQSLWGKLQDIEAKAVQEIPVEELTLASDDLIIAASTLSVGPEVSPIDSNAPPSTGPRAPQVPPVLETPLILDESAEEVTATCPETPATKSALPEHDEHLMESPVEQPEPAPVKTLWKKLRNIVRRPVKKIPVKEPSLTSDDLVVAVLTPEVVDVEVSPVNNDLPPSTGLLALAWNFKPQIPAVLETEAGKGLLPCVPFCLATGVATLPESRDDLAPQIKGNKTISRAQLLFQVEPHAGSSLEIIRPLSWTAAPVASVIQEPEVSTVDNNVPSLAGLLALPWNFTPQVPPVLETPLILDESAEEVTATCPETPAAQSALPEHEERLIETPVEQPEPAPVKTLWKKLRNIVRRPVKKIPVKEPSLISDDLIIAAPAPEVVEVEVSALDSNNPLSTGLLALAWNFKPQIPAVLETEAGKGLLPCVPFCLAVVAVTLPEPEEDPVWLINDKVPDRSQLFLKVETHEEPILGVIRLLGWTADPAEFLVQEPEQNAPTLGEDDQLALSEGKWNQQVNETDLLQIFNVIQFPLKQRSENGDSDVAAVPCVSEALLAGQEPHKFIPGLEQLTFGVFLREEPAQEILVLHEQEEPPRSVLLSDITESESPVSDTDEPANEDICRPLDQDAIPQAIAAALPDDNGDKLVADSDHRNHQGSMPEVPAYGDLAEEITCTETPATIDPSLVEDTSLPGPAERKCDEPATAESTLQGADTEPDQEFHERAERLREEISRKPEESVAPKTPETHHNPFAAPVSSGGKRKPKEPRADVLDAHIAELQCRIDELRSFDIDKVEGRFDPGAKALGDAVNKTLATIYGPDTYAYWQHAITSLDKALVVVGGPKPSPEEIRRAFQRGIKDAMAKLMANLETLNEKRQNLPAQEPDDVESDTPPDPPCDNRIVSFSRREEHSREQVTRKAPEAHHNPFSAPVSSEGKGKPKGPRADVLDAHIAELQCRIDELRSFDIDKVEGRFDPGATALGDAVNKTMATIYGPDTYAYWQHAITSLDKALVVVGGPKPSPEEVRRAYRRGINDAITKVTATLESLNEKRRNLPAQAAC